MTNTAHYPADLESDDVLADGSLVHFRPIAGVDAPRLVVFHESLSSETVYLRFFTPHPHLTGAEVERFTNVDYVDRLAIIAEVNGVLVAVGRFDRLAPEAPEVADVPERGDAADEELPTAEVAFVVADAWQHRGIGSLLLEKLAGAARQRGIRRFRAETLAQNRAMLSVFEASGYDVTWTESLGTCQVVFPIVRGQERAGPDPC